MKPEKTSVTPGYLKADAGKLRPSLLPQPALQAVLSVLEAGASVYGDWGWHAGISYTRLLDAAERHLAALRLGETRSDHEMRSGAYGFHVAHAICELLFLLEFQLEGREDLNDLCVLIPKEPI